MPDEHDDDDFEGIDINGPWGGVRIGGGRMGGRAGDADPEYRAVRRRVHRRLEFYRHAAFYVFVVGGLALIDWASGGGWWVQWLAIIWGAFLAVQFFSNFVSPNLWGRDVEERMVRRELERRRGRVHVSHPDEPPPTGD
jgi:hypothetical protein